ncbi:MAG: threonylcarbamoyl-AMP synthase [Cyclobacteriaceae bacterium]|nr:threonylcarbamoyl-AMP synthase [Cyclobacteriaceae bacterium]
MAIIGSDIKEAIRFLMDGNLVGIPTETVYGLAGNALDDEVVLRIFEVKKRPAFDPLIVHIGTRKALFEFVPGIPQKAEKLAARFWPGPLTLILQKNRIIPDVVTSGLPTVAVRMPDHPMTLELLNSLSFPLAAPSANPFGYVSPTTAQHVAEQLGDRIPYILDGGDCDIGIESTIIGFEGDEPVIHRLGGKSVEEIEDLVGKVKVIRSSSSRPSGPGMMESHYAPGNKKVFLGHWEQYRSLLDPARTVLIRYHTPDPDFPRDRQAILSDKADLREAAKNLFTTLRRFDVPGISYIVAELLPEEGFGRAINDRLRRAASKD